MENSGGVEDDLLQMLHLYKMLQCSMSALLGLTRNKASEMLHRSNF